MQKSKLHYYLSRISEEERDRFQDFCDSPYLNRKPTLSHLYRTFRTTVLESDPPCQSREELWAHLYPDRPFKDGYLRKMLSGLLSLFMEYLAIERFRGDEVQQKQFAIESSTEQNYIKYLKPEISGFFRKIQNSPQTLESPSHLLNLKKTHLLLLRKSKAPDHRKIYKEKEDIIFQVFFANLLHNAINHWNHCLAMSYDHPDISKIETQIKFNEKSFGPQNPLIVIFLCVLDLLKSQSEKSSLENLKYNLIKYQNKISSELKFEFYSLGINISTKNVNAGIKPEYFLVQIFEFYQEMLSQNLLLTNGLLSHKRYKMIIGLGVRVKKLRWLIDFIKTYEKKLDVNQNGTEALYCKGYFSFHQGNIKKAKMLMLAALQQSNANTDIEYELDVRGYLMRCFLENEEWDDLFYYGDSFSQFLRRSKTVSNRQKFSFGGLNKAILKIAKIGSGNRTKEKEKILETLTFIESLGKLPYVFWLKTKLDQYKNQ